MRHVIPFLLSLFVLPLAAAHGADAAKPAQPLNVIVILADDLGYECLGVNGSKSYKTPNLDRLAGEGVRFTHCYAQPNCTPSRVQLLTGMSNVRNYISLGELESSQTTFAHMFRNAGYATAIAGKWQLGSKDPGLTKHFGFDEHCLWAYMGRGERYADPTLTINGELKTLPGQYGPDVCHQFLVDFIRRNREKPFCIYYPMILTHGGFEATPDSSDYGKATAKDNDRAIRQRHFGEMVTYMDKLVGNLTSELKSMGLAENTLVLFTGDNGTASGIQSTLEDGSAMAGEKGNTTRAGMHVPLIAHWPGSRGQLAAGTVCNDLVDLTDFLPTICQATGVTSPEHLPIDGRSFLPQLRGQPTTPREWIYSYWVPLRETQTANVGSRGAVEQAFDHHYKLYSTGDFFDLTKDPREEKPQKVSALTGEPAEAAKKLQAALNSYKDARPTNLAPPKEPAKKEPGEKEKREKKRKAA